MVGWQWAAPRDPVTRYALGAMLAGLVGLAIAAALGLTPIVWQALRCPRRGQLMALALLLGGIATLAIAGAHFAHGWPGTGGHRWSGRSLVPGGPASFAWAITLSLTSYWAHPGALGSFPPGEVAWMAGAPLAIGAVLAGATTLVRRSALDARALRYEARLVRAAALAMLVFLAGALCWLLGASGAPHGLFATGAIDALEVAAMIAACAAVLRLSAAVNRDIRPPDLVTYVS
jgi:hypothetical protein